MNVCACYPGFSSISLPNLNSHRIRHYIIVTNSPSSRFVPIHPWPFHVPEGLFNLMDGFGVTRVLSEVVANLDRRAAVGR